MLGRAEVGEQGGHLVEGSAADRLVVSAATQVVTNALLVVPQQPVQRQHVSVTDERHRVRPLVLSLAVRCYLDEEPGTRQVL